MEKYNEKIADNPKVELIQISRDQSDAAAEEWAKNDQFPWFSVFPGDVDRSKLSEYQTTRSLPYYSLRAADGTELANGSRAVFLKIAELDEAKE